MQQFAALLRRLGPSLLGGLALSTTLLVPAALEAQTPARVPRLPVVADPEMRDLQAIQQAPAPRPLPRRLRGATVNRTGPVHAAVFSYAYGLRPPIMNERQVAYELLGVVRDTLDLADGVAARLLDASGGAFRLDASMVFPTLVETAGSQADITKAFGDAGSMSALVHRILTPWLERANLASYDNDGPDGLPSSGDDDGVIDLPLIVIETDSLAASAIVPLDWNVRTGPGGRYRARFGQVYVIAVPRHAALDPDNLLPTQAVLRALGVTGDLFALGHRAGEIGILPRLQLGWVAPRRVVRSGVYSLEDLRPLAVPGLGAPTGVITWYVEQAGDWVGVSQVVRRADGREVVAMTRTVARGQQWETRLDPQSGVEGPWLQVRWEGGRPVVAVDLQPRP